MQRWGLWEALRSAGGALLGGISTLITEAPELPSPSIGGGGGHSKDMAIHDQEAALPRPRASL